MKIANLVLLLLLGAPLLNAQASSGEEPAPAAKPGFAYHVLDPDIITNYPGEGSSLGYVRVTVALMAGNGADLTLLEQHDPLIRDAIIRLLGSKSGAQIKSLASREELRKECEEQANELLAKETGRRPVRELIFTKYLYQ